MSDEGAADAALDMGRFGEKWYRYPMNALTATVAVPSIDRFPEVDATASLEAQECRARIAKRKGSLPAPYGLLVHSPAVAHAFLCRLHFGKGMSPAEWLWIGRHCLECLAGAAAGHP